MVVGSYLHFLSCTGWDDCFDGGILLWPRKCGEGTPAGRGHCQHYQPGEIHTVHAMEILRCGMAQCGFYLQWNCVC